MGHSTNPRRQNQQGIALIGLCLVVGVLMALGFQAFSLVIQNKTNRLHRQLRASRQAAVFEMINSRVLAELKRHYRDSTDPNKTVPPLAAPGLTHLLRGTSRLYSPAYPRVFGKGQFQIDMLTAGGGVSPLFVAPERDVRVVLGPLMGGGYHQVTIETAVCRDVVAGRVRFPPETTAVPHPGLGVNWPTPCPARQLVNVNYSLYVNTAAPGFGA